MPELYSLRTGGIDLWLADYEEIDDASLHDQYRTLLSEEEKQQEPRFYFARDRRRYLVTRAMVRTVLSKYAPVRAEEWAFSANSYGRPEIANETASDFQLSFNVSHTHSLIVLGITQRRALGVDVENVKARDALLDVADRYFARDEVAALNELPAARRHHRFFEYWTFKESYIKARGMGLSLPLDKFGFYFPNDRAVAIDIHSELQDRAARWQFWQFQPAAQYLVAVCAERDGARKSNILVRSVVPLRSEQLLSVDFLRTTPS